MDPIPLRWKFILGLVARLPQGLISRCTGWLAAASIPGPFRRPILGAFARAVGIDVTEAEKPLSEYPSVSHFFTRRLRTGVRGWPSDPGVPASPVDGRVGAVGRIRNGEAIQAKGIPYQVAELLGVGAGERVEDRRGKEEEEGSTLVPRLEGGTFVTLYLSPRDYHRIHAPLGGVVQWGRIVPGALFPVNASAVAAIPRLFPRNERLVAWIEGTGAPVGLVAVGAFNVGGISALYDPAWHRAAGAGRSLTNRRGRHVPETRRYDPPRRIERGEELMAFHLGSTVVLLFGADDSRGDVHPSVRPGEVIRLGAPLFQ